ncbi:hypothetical protein DL89DRAFT_232383 [Linderina pennispora]|uniref:Uncharacterized protein n=1 Tax=Linderina pennispora TaxID=61395 RepID=A0A1Y1WN85_9FUNG|nr:uncharacterized protein DL89DRAFT_232383 [Linderina pennispora]ORX74973.1 hypothetical protein DL89DRAFT_232383 [Linderina pennispora]
MLMSVLWQPRQQLLLLARRVTQRPKTTLMTPRRKMAWKWTRTMRTMVKARVLMSKLCRWRQRQQLQASHPRSALRSIPSHQRRRIVIASTETLCCFTCLLAKVPNYSRIFQPII